MSDFRKNNEPIRISHQEVMDSHVDDLLNRQKSMTGASGLIGGLLGGLLFDPIDLIILGTDKPSAHISRLVGFSIIGLG